MIFYFGSHDHKGSLQQKIDIYLLYYDHIFLLLCKLSSFCSSLCLWISSFLSLNQSAMSARSSLTSPIPIPVSIAATLAIGVLLLKNKEDNANNAPISP